MIDWKHFDFDHWKQILVKYRVILIMLCAGFVLLLIPPGSPQEGNLDQDEWSERFVLEEFETKLADILSDLDGAGKCRVMLTVKGSSRKILAQDTQQDDSRLHTAPVILGRGSMEQDVVPVQITTPEFRGALVMCPGGENPRVQYAVSSAVSALTGLKSNRILVLKGT